jgi:glycerol-3-phosphate dehydrogenase
MKSMDTKITIIGAGAIGRAIEHILLTNGRAPVLWDKDTTKVPNQGELGTAVAGSQIVFLCVPSWVLRSACEMLRPHLSSEAILVGISKGLEQGTKLRTDEVLVDVFPQNEITLLSGPMLASEIRTGAKAYAIIGAQNLATGNRSP